MSRRGIAISWPAILGTVALLYFTMVVCFSLLMQCSLRDTFAAISNVELACPPGATQGFERWGMTGYSVSCRQDGAKQGPWQAWEGGRIWISGHFARDRMDGTWLFYSGDGMSVYRTITYSDGVELSNVIHSPLNAQRPH